MASHKTDRVLVVGLGNPGSKYVGTRHNIGFVLAEALAQMARIPLSREKFKGVYGTGEFRGRPTTILLPQTYMNRSGESVSPALSFFDLEPPDCIVLHDDLDLELGDVRVKIGGGHGGHNGLRSIANQLGRKDFIRIRLGIGRPAHGNVTSYVLGRFSSEESAHLEDVIDLGLRALENIFEDGPRAAMNAINGVYKARKARANESS